MRNPFDPHIKLSCGCCGGSQTGNDTGCGPTPEGALICDNRYYSLTFREYIKLLGVEAGSNCQAFLKLRSGQTRGFVFVNPSGLGYIEHEPVITLPLWNPAVSSVYPPGDPFSYLLIGHGDPAAWKHLRAPSTGEYILQTEAGLFVLKPAGSIPGVASVCSDVTGVTGVNLFGCFFDEDEGDEGAYVSKKLTVIDKRLVIGDTSGLLPVHRHVAEGETVEIESIHVTDKIIVTQIVFTDEDGNEVVDGIEELPDVVVDAIPVLYSPSTKKYYQAPAHYRENLTVNADAGVADNGSYQSVGGGHMLFSSKTFNYDWMFISCCVRVSNDASNYSGMDFGLFIDNALVHTWDVKGAKDSTISKVHNIGKGIHTVEIRFRQTAAAGASTVVYSNTDIFTLP